MRRPASLVAWFAVLLALDLVAAPPAAAEAVWPSARYRVDDRAEDTLERSTFVIGGLGFWSDPSSLLSTAWGMGGGVILPVRSWAVVPRVDVEGGGEDNSSAWMARASLGGRIPAIVNGRHTFIEGGFGVAYCERHAAFAYTAPGFGAPPDPNTSLVTPCLVLASGVTSDPLQRPMFLLETDAVLSSDRDGPTVIMIRMGLGF